jgi:hypothetical protein
MLYKSLITVTSSPPLIELEDIHLFEYVCIHMYIYVLIYLYACIYTYMNTCICVNIYEYLITVTSTPLFIE